MAPLFGVLHGKRYTYQWSTLLIWIYAAEGRHARLHGPRDCPPGSRRAELALALAYFVVAVRLRALDARRLRPDAWGARSARRASTSRMKKSSETVSATTARDEEQRHRARQVDRDERAANAVPISRHTRSAESTASAMARMHDHDAPREDAQLALEARRASSPRPSARAGVVLDLAAPVDGAREAADRAH